MKKLLFAVVVLLFVSCAKDEDEKKLESNAKIRFTCTSVNPYNGYVDNVFQGMINGNSFKEFYVSPGYHTFKAEQVSGYALYPTVVTSEATVVAGQEVGFTFP